MMGMYILSQARCRRGCIIDPYIWLITSNNMSRLLLHAPSTWRVHQTSAFLAQSQVGTLPRLLCYVYMAGQQAPIATRAAVAVPHRMQRSQTHGNLVWPALMMVCVRRGTAMKTPKNASPRDQSSSFPGDSTIGPNGGFCPGVIMPSAGMMPTRPATRQAWQSISQSITSFPAT